jgi:hypothetical protein
VMWGLSISLWCSDAVVFYLLSIFIAMPFSVHLTVLEFYKILFYDSARLFCIAVHYMITLYCFVSLSSFVF